MARLAGAGPSFAATDHGRPGYSVGPRFFYLPRFRNLNYVLREHLPPSRALDALLAANQVLHLNVWQRHFASEVDVTFGFKSQPPQRVGNSAGSNALTRFKGQIPWGSAEVSVTICPRLCRRSKKYQQESQNNGCPKDHVVTLAWKVSPFKVSRELFLRSTRCYRRLILSVR